MRPKNFWSSWWWGRGGGDRKTVKALTIKKAEQDPLLNWIMKYDGNVSLIGVLLRKLKQEGPEEQRRCYRTASFNYSTLKIVDTISVPSSRFFSVNLSQTSASVLFWLQPERSFGHVGRKVPGEGQRPSMSVQLTRKWHHSCLRQEAFTLSDQRFLSFFRSRADWQEHSGLIDGTMQMRADWRRGWRSDWKAAVDTEVPL